MTQTYSQLQQKIAKLQKEADVLRQKEMSGVVARIKVAIEHYGLTGEQLGFGGAKTGAKLLGRAETGAKYRDGNGQSWSGRGPRPHWLRDAIAGGASLESFLVAGGARAAKVSITPAKSAAKAYKRAPSTLLYQDGAGNSWTGRGPQPRWLQGAVAGGKSLESFLGTPGEASTSVKAVDVPVKSKVAKPAKRRASAGLYKDGTGNSWSGFGPQPRWLKEAIAGGKSLQELKG